MERLIWMLSPAPGSPLTASVERFSGTYAAEVGGTDCLFRLWFEGNRFVHGACTAEEETLEVQAGFAEQTERLPGFLLELYGHAPVAILSARATPEGLRQLGTPEFDTLMDLYGQEEVVLSKVWDLPELSEVRALGDGSC